MYAGDAYFCSLWEFVRAARVILEDSASPPRRRGDVVSADSGAQFTESLVRGNHVAALFYYCDADDACRLVVLGTLLVDLECAQNNDFPAERNDILMAHLRRIPHGVFHDSDHRYTDHEHRVTDDRLLCPAPTAFNLATAELRLFEDDTRSFIEAMLHVDSIARNNPHTADTDQWGLVEAALRDGDLRYMQWRSADHTSAFYGAVRVAAHMCARDDLLAAHMSRGVRVWCAYCYQRKFPLEVDVGRALQLEGGATVQFERIAVSELSDAEHAAINAMHRTLAADMPLPENVCAVPFEEVLGLVGARRVMLVRGRAYVSYVHMAEWAHQRWDAEVARIGAHDRRTILEPLRQRYKQRRALQVGALPEKSHFERSDDYTARLQPQLQEFWGDFEERLRWVSYVPAARLPNGGRWNSVMAMHREMFGATIAWWKSRRRQLVHRQRALTYATPSDRPLGKALARMHRQPSGDLVSDYGDILPPCVSRLVTSDTHLRDSQRVFLFRYLAHMGLPLVGAQQMWFELCRRDSALRVSQRSADEFARLNYEYGRYPEALYATQYKIERSPRYHGGFMSCETVQNNFTDCCPYVGGDIEDLGMRKFECGECMWDRQRDERKRADICVWPAEHWGPRVAALTAVNRACGSRLKRFRRSGRNE